MLEFARGGDTMATQSKRITIYLDEDFFNAFQLKGTVQSRSISDLVNQAVKESLAKDAENVPAFEEKVNEAVISYGEMLTKLKKEGRI